MRRDILLRLTAIVLLATTADQFLLISMVWFSLETTGAPAAAAAVVLAHQVPGIVCSPLAGCLMNRLGAARLIALDNAARAACLTPVPVLWWLDMLSFPLVVACVAAAGALSPFTYAGSRSLVPALASNQDLPKANGWLSFGDQLSFTLGPALGGIATAALGGAAAIILPIAGLVLAACLAPRLHGIAPVLAGAPHGFFDGFRPLLGDASLRALLVLSAAYYFAYGPLEPALAVYARDELGVGSFAFGMMWGAFGAGAVLGVGLVKPLAASPPGIVNGLGVVAFGLATLPIVFARQPEVAVALLFCGGVIWGPYTAIEATIIQRRVPLAQLASVFAARRALLMTALPLGAAAGGALLHRFSGSTVIGASAAACIIAGLACLSTRALRRAGAE